jgi:hypothetical protein
MDAAFRPGGGVFFFVNGFSKSLNHTAVQRNSLLFFFRSLCRKERPG